MQVIRLDCRTINDLGEFSVKEFDALFFREDFPGSACVRVRVRACACACACACVRVWGRFRRLHASLTFLLGFGFAKALTIYKIEKPQVQKIGEQ